MTMNVGPSSRLDHGGVGRNASGPTLLANDLSGASNDGVPEIVLLDQGTGQCAVGPDARAYSQSSKFIDNIPHRCVGIAEESRAADADKPPACSLQYRLTREVVWNLLCWVVPIAVTFQGHLLCAVRDHHIDSIAANLDLRLHVETCRKQDLDDSPLEW